MQFLEHLHVIQYSKGPRNKSCMENKVGTTQSFTIGFFQVFQKKSNHLMSSKHRSYSVLLQISWNYRAKGRMSANSNVNCAESWNITMVLFAESNFFALKPKTQCIGRKKLVFPRPWWRKMLMKSTVDRKSHNDWYKIVWECWSGIKSI